MILQPLTLPGVAYVCRNLRAADVREIEATRWAAHDPDELAIDVMRTWAPGGQGWLVHGKDGKPVACFGATQPWPGMFSAWLLATDDFPLVALGVTRFVKRIFIPHLHGRGHRVEARSIDGHEAAHRWLACLGATEEARLKGYGRNGQDFIVFTLARPTDASSVDRID